MDTAIDPLDDLSEQDLAKVEELAKKCLVEGATLADVKGYTEDELEAVYHLAYNAYQQRKYDKAHRIFQFLVHHDHMESRFWMGLAASSQMSGSNKQAVTAYGMAAVLDATNPVPALHAGECYLALGDSENARKALDAVEYVSGLTGASAHARTRTRAAALAAALEKSESAPGGPSGAPRHPAEASEKEG